MRSSSRHAALEILRAPRKLAALGRARAVSLFLLAGAVGAFVACGSSEDRECNVGADCASGACSADGMCVRVDPNAPANSSTTESTDAAADSSNSVTDAGTDSNAVVDGCVPNKDGIITREEVPLAAGLHATYRVAINESFATAGTPQPDGTVLWDLSTSFPSDTSVIVETQPLAGKWYAGDFPNATYASKLSESSTLIGVFETANASLLLRGVVSPTNDTLSKTELTNKPPVEVINYPLKADATWSTDTTVSGTYTGVPFTTYTEHYESKVDAKGTLKTPLGSFQVLRVNTVLTRTVGFVKTVIRTHSFVTECYGTIAVISSKDNESDEEFSSTAEIRRLSP
ncbi:hypothetical protein AKJ09_01847 [Labilithrix luteola]|uniref:Uncharacterized protein n=1 Tax=Labilithrix luteola TaxID=1391654 RepID=A0A0K1PNT0_9BACT|nr:hypothetical protein [Labilithrix luteola]AKU95183.1 hypothetical protein AKJ09_01847 [Labilithrix luteola]